MVKVAKKSLVVPKKRVAKKPQPRGHVRNFYVHGYIGDCLADGTIEPKKTISNGPWSKIGGLDATFYQRASKLDSGAVAALRVECRATPEGKLTIRAFDVVRGIKVFDSESWRDGVPVEEDNVTTQSTS
jgi:hypothetical protein